VGVIIGTAAYMSPEQANGKRVDKRADIWAFGCVLYEMLAGYRPFPGETASEVIAAILEREPDWTKLPAATPVSLRHVLLRCLEKDPKDRLRDIGDARLDLEEAQAGPSQSDQRKAAVMTRRTTITAVAGAAVGSLATGLFLTRRWHGAVPRNLTRFSIAIPEPDYLFAFWTNLLSIAADGGRIAFATRESDVVPHFYIRSFSNLESKLIKG
jgi:hypothetical protein